MHHGTILHLTGMKSTKYGGIERYLLELARYCKQKGYHTVLQYEQLPQSSAYLNDLKETDTEVVILKTRANFPRCAPKMAGLISSVRPKVIQTHFYNDCILFGTPIVAKAVGVKKTINMVHGNPDSTKKSKRRFAFNRYDHVLAVSNAVANTLVLTGINQKIVSTHYLGLLGHREYADHLHKKFREEFGIPKQATVLANIAFDTAFKGLDILLTALAQVISSCPQVHLIQIGVDPQQSKLPKQAADLGIADHVHWAGIRDEGWQLLNAANIYVHSSRFGEGLPLAVMEAMALKLPIVGTKVAGIPEAVIDGETGYLAEPGSPDAFAGAVKHMLSDTAQWHQLGQAGYDRYLRLFKGENSIKSLVETYFQL